ncbi:MAG: MerR family transcriptional regulator [Candidatus Tectomicrobia bacterium]|nr:MerR family transcriptional regulator [Candidatus Tectomicrobia bacterium]
MAAKPFFKIGEVARLLGVKPHVLRYWEAEFPTLKPRKNPSGQRLYARADIEALTEIRDLLYTDCYTISGARQLLAYQCHASRRGVAEGVHEAADEPASGLPTRPMKDDCDGPAADTAAPLDLEAAVTLLKQNIHEMMAMLRKSHRI